MVKRRVENHHCLSAIRAQGDGIAASIRWACVLEATAPKAGNVYPGRNFDSLTHGHFMVAAEIAAVELTRFEIPVCTRMLHCVRETTRQTGTNVNLGIVLLMGPLAESLHLGVDVGRVLESWDDTDGAQVSEAIRIAGAGGMGRVDQRDVNDPSARTDIMAAMKSAADRDRIARQYAGDFHDLMTNVVPVLETSLQDRGDILMGISDAHLRLLAIEPDSLIARKNGMAVAVGVQKRAGDLNRRDPVAVGQFDQWLRSDGNRLNPGTTADLIAAALLVLLCERDLN